jgi:tripartite-type tricarboxylate transporter receptor subunit TctC
MHFIEKKGEPLSMKQRLSTLFSCAVLLASGTLALAQTPTPAAPTAAPATSGQTVTLMVPYPPGGPSDAIARNLAPAFQKVMGQTVIVENLGGASGAIAAQKLLTIQNDGRMFFQGSPNELILAPMVNTDIKIKPEQFRLVSKITENPLVLFAKNDLPVSNLDELIEYAKKQGDKGITYGSVGIGSMYHIVMEDLAKQTGIKVTHVPYKGAAPMMQDIFAGAVDVTILPYQTSYVGLQADKKIKLLGWVSKARNPFIPTLASFGESKSLPNFEHAIWAGIFVRKDTPEDVIKKISADLAKVMKDDEVRASLTKLGSIVVDTTAQDAADKYFDAEIAKFNVMTKDIKLAQ